MVGWEPPLAGRGVKSPVLRCAASHRLRLARLTLKVLTTSARAMPRSSAASTRSRKSTEYAFIEHQHTTSSAVVLTAIGHECWDWAIFQFVAEGQAFLEQHGCPPKIALKPNDTS